MASQPQRVASERSQNNLFHSICLFSAQFIGCILRSLRVLDAGKRISKAEWQFVLLDLH